MSQVNVSARNHVFPGQVISMTREGAILHFSDETPSLQTGEMMIVTHHTGVREGKVIFMEEHPAARRLHVRFKS